jgi:hypothetical protein
VKKFHESDLSSHKKWLCWLENFCRNLFVQKPTWHNHLKWYEQIPSLSACTALFGSACSGFLNVSITLFSLVSQKTARFWLIGYKNFFFHSL